MSVPSLKWLLYSNTLQSQLDIIEWIKQYVMRPAMLRCPLLPSLSRVTRDTWHGCAGAGHLAACRPAPALDHGINVGPGALPAQSSPAPAPGDTVTRQ